MLSLTAINFGATVNASAPVAIGSELFFTANEATHGNQVWETNGTAAGTVRLSDGHDVKAQRRHHPLRPHRRRQHVFFPPTTSPTATRSGRPTAPPPAPRWSATSTPAATASSPTDLTAVGDTLYFVGYDPNDGMQLFESDGTAAGTQMVADIPGANGYPGSYPTDLTAAGGMLYFSATDATHGTQLWSANPSTGATTMLTRATRRAAGRCRST